MTKKKLIGPWGIAWRVALSLLIALAVVSVLVVAAVRLGHHVAFLAPALPQSGDTTTLLGAATVALGTAALVLTFVGFLVALIALIGWQSMLERVDSQVSLAMGKERQYDHGQGRLTQGVTFGLINQYLTRIVPEVGEEAARTFFLEDSISYLERAASDLRGNELECHALNSLAYSLALRGHPRDAKRAWELMQDCEVLARKHGRHESFPLTKGTVVGRFGAELPGMTTADIRALRREVEQTPITESVRFRQHEKAIVLRELDALLESRPNEEPPPKRGRLRGAWEALRGR